MNRTQISIGGNEYIRICYRCGVQFIAYLGQRKCNECAVGHYSPEYRDEMENRIREICEVLN